MDTDWEFNLWEMITVLEAQEALNTLMINSFNHLKQSEREKLHRKLLKQAYPDSFSKPREISTQDLAKFLGG